MPGRMSSVEYSLHKIVDSILIWAPLIFSFSPPQNNSPAHDLYRTFLFAECFIFGLYDKYKTEQEARNERANYELETRVSSAL